jgi:hypothetical protein
MQSSNNTILSVSFAPGVAKKRQKALESAGLHVVIAKPEAVLPACKKHRRRLFSHRTLSSTRGENDAFIQRVKYFVKANDMMLIGSAGLSKKQRRNKNDPD